VGARQVGFLGQNGGALPEFLVIGGALIQPAEQGVATLIVKMFGERPG
jgi:hypothetical protein